MKKNILAFFLLMVIGIGKSFAVLPDDLSNLVKHLEFLGYDISMDGEGMKAAHPSELNIYIQKYHGGILITASFTESKYGKNNRGEFLALINKLNERATIGRYYIDTKGGRLCIEAYYPGNYNKQTFGVFLDVFNSDRSHLGEVGIGKYIE